MAVIVLKYTCRESTCYTPSIYTMLYVNYISIELQEKHQPFCLFLLLSSGTQARPRGSSIAPCGPHWGPLHSCTELWLAGAGGFKMAWLHGWQLLMAACWEFSWGCQQVEWLYLSLTWLLRLSHRILTATQRKSIPSAWEGKLRSPYSQL